ncbi:hypothetical protein HO133_010543 [Letharia lupina]|uniref:Uncharacterized protein n=1 Tax=Letharia lupina TaxID=560253 RepID=A0A8H6FDL4_9LECA|nr:uncharacterized protein HO133_010543 [Letharia lupina]KAF6223969.1 hypothetical protein HO133_010543 [Letharia lupina]
MAPFNCCSFRRAVSPEPQPAVLTDISRTGERFALSSHTPSRAASHENVSNAQPIAESLASATKNDVAHEFSTASGNDMAPAHGTESGVHRRGSNRRLHDVASKVRKRMSRDSGMSKRSSKTRLNSSLSEDGYQRREELKRALHQRVQEDIDEGSKISDGSYDEDAVPIKTPRGTWGRHEGSIQISPKHLSHAIRRSESPSAYAELDPRTLSQVYAPKNTAVALSRMLVQRGSNLARESEGQAVDSKVENARRASTTQKYNFSDDDSPIRVLKTRSHSPLGRSNTVLHMPSSTKALQIDVANPEFLNTPGASSAPDLLPMYLKTVRDSAAGGDWRLSFADIRQGASSNEANETHRSTLRSARLPGVYDTRIRPASEQLLHGTSGLWGHPVHPKHSNTHFTTDTHTSSPSGHCCIPGSEEMSFGGTDGKGYSPPTSEEAGSLARQRGRSEGSDPVHLYNMHIPQRLASRPLLPSVSLPQLEHPRRDRSYTSGSSSRMFSVLPRSQVSSSMSSGGKQFKTPATHPTSSSVYSSGSLPPSPPDSRLHFHSLSDRLYPLEVFHPSEEIISVPASRPKSVDLDNLERRTVETSYHSSNESLMNRELAAAETRISPMPRANTLPKNSRFREDLERISAELALTNPPRRRVSNLDGARSPTKEDATSIWERALREHSQEDKAISHTRIGSTSPDSVEPRQLDPKTVASIEQKARKRSSFLRTKDRRVPEPLEGAHLQAHLGAYALPPRRANTRKRPTREGIQKSPSTIRASSWARYPSHTRPERSTSPAGESDQVYSRDFAITPPGTEPKVSSEHGSSPLSNGKKWKTNRMTFGKQLLSTISNLYKSQSQELQRRLADEARGNRSSISEGGGLEYPELEMLGSLSPPMPSPDITTKLQLEDHVRKASEPPSDTQTRGPQSGQVSRKQSQDWAREYQDCIQPQSGRPIELYIHPESPPFNPRDYDTKWPTEFSDEALEEASVPPRRASETIGPNDTPAEGSGSPDGKADTLDEWKARERIRLLGLETGEGVRE